MDNVKETENITISIERYNELLEAERMLDALYGAGVDNWDGYEFALNEA